MWTIYNDSNQPIVFDVSTPDAFELVGKDHSVSAKHENIVMQFDELYDEITMTRIENDNHG